MSDKNDNVYDEHDNIYDEYDNPMKKLEDYRMKKQVNTVNDPFVLGSLMLSSGLIVGWVMVLFHITMVLF